VCVCVLKIHRKTLFYKNHWFCRFLTGCDISGVTDTLLQLLEVASSKIVAFHVSNLSDGKFLESILTKLINLESLKLCQSTFPTFSSLDLPRLQGRLYSFFFLLPLLTILFPIFRSTTVAIQCSIWFHASLLKLLRWKPIFVRCLSLVSQ
jgi:hypothetical protein